MKGIIIIGAGAAGLVAAGFALKNGYEVTLIEQNNIVGKKLLITGKGRCNVTNNCDNDRFLRSVRSNHKFLYSAINYFGTADTMALFENLSVPLKTERGGRVFPVSDKSSDIVAALKRYSKASNLVQGKAEKLLIKNGVVTGVELSDKKQFFAEKVIVATGGISYPDTGSTGDGYRIAKEVGHTIVPPTPSLVALTTKNLPCSALMGLTLKNITLTLVQNGKKIFQEQGEMLFTHFGVSGPLVLSASAHIKGDCKDCFMLLDLKPALTAEQLYSRVTKDFELLAAKNASNSLVKLLPSAIIPYVLSVWNIQGVETVNQITKQQRNALVSILKGLKIEIAKKEGLRNAVITAGGVSTSEIDPKTMQSKKVRGLYFAGEIIDVDAYTGGFNLQIAFSTAALAAL